MFNFYRKILSLKNFFAALFYILFSFVLNQSNPLISAFSFFCSIPYYRHLAIENRSDVPFSFPKFRPDVKINYARTGTSTRWLLCEFSCDPALSVSRSFSFAKKRVVWILIRHSHHHHHHFLYRLSLYNCLYRTRELDQCGGCDERPWSKREITKVLFPRNVVRSFFFFIFLICIPFPFLLSCCL